MRLRGTRTSAASRNGSPRSCAHSLSEEESSGMTPEDNKALVRRFIKEIFEEGRADAVDELVAGDFVRHIGPSGDTDRDDLRSAMARVSKGLADVEFTIEDMVAEGNRVAVR